MNSKMYKIGFFVLLAINILMVIVFAFRPKPPMQAAGIGTKIEQELGFSEAQKETFGKMVHTHQQAIRALEDQKRELVRSFFNQLNLDNSNGQKDVLLQQMLEVEKQKILATYTHFEELKAILTAEQLPKFEGVMQRIIPSLTNAPGRPMNPGQPPMRR